MPVRHFTDSWWLGNLAATVAHASVMEEPRPLLEKQLRHFLADRPADDPLARAVRKTLEGQT